MRVRKTAAACLCVLCVPLLAAWSRNRADDPPAAAKKPAPPPKKEVAKNTAGQAVGPRGPFNIKTATLQRLKKDTAAGNARVEVVFHSRPATDTVTVGDGEETVTLKADGRGTYSAVVRVDFEELRDEAVDPAAKENPDPKAAAPGQPAEAPVFDGRHVVGRRAPAAALAPNPAGPIDLLGPWPCVTAVDPMRSLMIVHPDVVGDLARTRDPVTGAGNGNGVWSFGHVMKVLADQPNTGITPAAFARRWLRNWEHDQVVNNFTAEQRDRIRALVIDPWPRVPGTDDLDLSKAPFRLIAIVNRVDLRDNFLFDIPPAALAGGPGNVQLPPVVVRESSGGEARLIYGVVDAATKQNLPFTVIFEFGVHKRKCGDIKAWARQWHDLQKYPLGSPRYNRALARITGQFIQPALDPARPSRPFGLNQVRTNEIALVLPPSDPSPPPRFWELREFRVVHEGSKKGHLRQSTVGQTPNNAAPGSPEDLNGKAVIADYINANVPDLLVNTHLVPLDFPAWQPFLGNRSLTLTAARPTATPSDKGFFWDGPTGGPSIVNNNARHHFSLNTCNGCHGGETGTPAFVMVSPTEAETDPARRGAKLAPFLTGVTFPDPVDGTPRTFDDLGRRKQDLEDLLCRPCWLQFAHRPVRMTH